MTTPDPLDEIDSKLTTMSPTALLGATPEAVEANYKALARLCHPDRNGGSARAAALFSRLGEFKVAALNPSPPIRSTKNTYTLRRLLAVGDAAEVHLAVGPNPAVEDRLLKISRIPAGVALLDNERAVLEALAKDATLPYFAHLPRFVESFMVRDKSVARRINAFELRPGGFTLPEVRARHAPLDSRHLAWIFRRMLAALGYVHRRGYVHGALVPPHVLVFPADHNVNLIGWGHAVKVGEDMRTVPAAYLDWYPPEVRGKKPAGPGTDVYLAAACMSYLSGGDPTRRTFGPMLEEPLLRFFGSCMLPGLRMRPNDAWALLDEFTEVLGRLFGPPKFVPLAM